MAKSKKTTTIEEVDEAEEKELDYTKDLKGKSIREVAEDATKPDTQSKEDTTSETPDPAPKTEEAKKEDTFDPEQFKKEAIAEATKEAEKRVRAEMADMLSGKSKADQEDSVDYLEKRRQTFEKEKGRQPTWTEVGSFIKDQAKEELKAEQEAAARAKDEEFQTNEKTKKEYYDAFEKEINDELTEMASAGILPKIKDINDEKDIGVVYRKALMDTMASVNAKRVQAGDYPIRSITRIHASHFKAPARQPSGADAPIGGSRSGTVTSTPEDEIDYFRDIKGGLRGLRNRFRR